MALKDPNFASTCTLIRPYRFDPITFYYDAPTEDLYITFTGDLERMCQTTEAQSLVSHPLHVGTCFSVTSIQFSLSYKTPYRFLRFLPEIRTMRIRKVQSVPTLTFISSRFIIAFWSQSNSTEFGLHAMCCRDISCAIKSSSDTRWLEHLIVNNRNDRTHHLDPFDV